MKSLFATPVPCFFFQVKMRCWKMLHPLRWQQDKPFQVDQYKSKRPAKSEQISSCFQNKSVYMVRATSLDEHYLETR
uniref:Uncharacterized protein n=1 Tax=Solanum lycopersicum TaxID=4081 RepID=A0A3Q7H5K0_SOLLC